MSTKICLGANTHQLLKAGGHVWVFLNWALGLKALGCDVVWLEQIDINAPIEKLFKAIIGLKQRLAAFGLGDSVSICTSEGAQLPHDLEMKKRYGNVVG